VALVLARLRNVAQEAGLRFNDILQAYVIERFLARLARSPHSDTVLLKGALMFRVWGVPRARPTMDIDLQNSRMKDYYDIWILSRTLAFSGPALSQAIRSTFDRRQTSVPIVPPAALTAEFYSQPVHVRQWASFVRRIGEAALANDFARVVGDLAQFLMPAAKAAATSADYPVRWEPLGPWQHC
jgi:Nucleotidyl transferase AbiEii toxin, Type IV TA system